MTWGTTHSDLVIGAARCEVAPVGAEAHAADGEVESGVMIDKHTLFECGKAGEMRAEGRGGWTGMKRDKR
jgi:hypothetical protein